MRDSTARALNSEIVTVSHVHVLPHGALVDVPLIEVTLLKSGRVLIHSMYDDALIWTSK